MRLADTARDAIERHRFRYARETELHAGLAWVFGDADLVVRREVPLGESGRAGRIDFTLTHPTTGDHVLGVEVKVAGSAPIVLQQLERYAPHVDELLLVTTRTEHELLTGLRAVLDDTGAIATPLTVVLVRGGGL